MCARFLYSLSISNTSPHSVFNNIIISVHIAHFRQHVSGFEKVRRGKTCAPPRRRFRKTAPYAKAVKQRAANYPALQQSDIPSGQGNSPFLPFSIQRINLSRFPHQSPRIKVPVNLPLLSASLPFHYRHIVLSYLPSGNTTSISAFYNSFFMVKAQRQK
jgi:hypothetical protein